MRNWTGREKVLFMITIILIFTLIFSGLAGVTALFKVDRAEEELREELASGLDSLEQMIQSGPSIRNKTEYEKALEFVENEAKSQREFLESETAKHREFIEQQRQQLIWLITTVGTLGLGVLAFFNFKSRKDIEDFIKGEHKKAIEEQLKDLIGGDEKQQYLNASIERQEMFMKKSILFLVHPGSVHDNECDAVRKQENKKIMNMVKDYYTNPSDMIAMNLENDLERDKIKVRKMINRYDIIVYEVLDQETGKEADLESMPVGILNAVCNEKPNGKQPYIILFASSGKVELYGPYINYANAYTTIHERINNLLELP